MQDILGKTAIITGASRGIGAATALELAARGIAVVLAARNTDQIQELAEKITQQGGRAQAVACDVADYASVENAMQTCINTFGRLDIFVGNAGTIDPIGALVTSNPDSWGQASDVNFKGIYHGLRAALPHMQAQKSGTIINVSSGAAHAPLEGWSHYCAAKAGAAMLTRAAHLEHEVDNLRIFGLSPGTVATGMQVAIKASGINPVSQLDPSVHVSPEWPAKVIAWLCTSDADPFKGQEVSLRDEDIRKRAGI